MYSAGAGIVVGQIISGLIGPYLGWKAPYAFTSVPNIILAIFLYKTIKEPMRGQSDKKDLNV